jgi:hypothetical protein
LLPWVRLACPLVPFLTVPLIFLLSELLGELTCLPAFGSDPLNRLPLFATFVPAAGTLVLLAATTVGLVSVEFRRVLMVIPVPGWSTV